VARQRLIAAGSVFLWLAHVVAVTWLGSAEQGPLVSDVIQLTLGLVLICAIVDASKRSTGFARSFWHLVAMAYLLWLIAQGLSVYGDLVDSTPIAWTQNLLFCFWFAPLAMALFLDPERDTGRLDVFVALDFVQATLVCVAGYVYFFYLPQANSPPELSESVWTPYFVGYGVVAVAFILRALVAPSKDVHVLFGRFGAFLILSGFVDAYYYYGVGANLKTGTSFDLLWSALLLVPAFIAVTWKQADAPALEVAPLWRGKSLHSEVFCLLYPLMVLCMSLRIALERLWLAALVVLLSFACSSARLLVTQNRLWVTREMLRWEASSDSLTAVWNHKAILKILERELVRAERDHQSVGVILIDVDHFKAINDNHGHAAGDSVLRSLAGEITAMLRPYDSLGRYGGEEFIIVAPSCDLRETGELAERIRMHVAACRFMAAGASIQVSLSLGVATGERIADFEKTLHASDTAMYEAKDAGRNRVEPILWRSACAGQNASG